MEQGGLSTGIEYPFVSHVLLPGYQEDRTARTYYSLETLWKKVREKQWRLLYSLNDSHMQDPGGARFVPTWLRPRAATGRITSEAIYSRSVTKRK